MLLLSTNSTRRATWDAKLGFQKQKMAFCTPLPSLYPDGGSVGCISAIILRKYPAQVRLDHFNKIMVCRDNFYLLSNEF